MDDRERRARGPRVADEPRLPDRRPAARRRAHPAARAASRARSCPHPRSTDVRRSRRRRGRPASFDAADVVPDRQLDPQAAEAGHHMGQLELGAASAPIVGAGVTRWTCAPARGKHLGEPEGRVARRSRPAMTTRAPEGTRIRPGTLERAPSPRTSVHRRVPGIAARSGRRALMLRIRPRSPRSRRRRRPPASRARPRTSSAAPVSSRPPCRSIAATRSSTARVQLPRVGSQAISRRWPPGSLLPLEHRDVVAPRGGSSRRREALPGRRRSRRS